MRYARAPKPYDPKPVTWVGADDLKLARKVLDQLRKAESVALDTEFPPEGPRRHEVLIWGLSSKFGERIVLHGEHLRKGGPEIFHDWLSSNSTRMVYFSYAADAEPVEHWSGIDLDVSFYADVMVTAWLRDNTKHRYALKEEEQDYLKIDRPGYGKLFCYVPEGKKKAIVVSPEFVRDGPLPPEMLAVRSQEEWLELFKRYNGDDAEHTHTLHRINKKVLKKQGYWKTFLEIDKPYTITLRKQQRRGVPIDTVKLGKLDLGMSIEKLRLETALRSIANKPGLSFSAQATSLRDLLFKEWEWPAYEDLMTAGGKNTGKQNKDGSLRKVKPPEPRLNKEAWRRYAEEEGFHFARLMIALNKVSKSKGTFVDGIGNGLKYGPNPHRKRLFSTLNQCGTSSGRMSSRKFKARIKFQETRYYKTRPPKVIEKEKVVKAGMNFLNFPNAFNDKEWGVRSVVVPPPPDIVVVQDIPHGKKRLTYRRKKLIVADFAGFELWLILNRCHQMGIKSRMLKAFMEGKDVHSMSAVAMCNLSCDWSEVKKLYPELRNDVGKKGNFGLGYGAGVRVFCRILGFDTRSPKALKKAEEYRNRWYATWPEMATYQDRMVRFAYEHGYVISLAGRRLWLKDGLNDKDEGVVRKHENKAKNVPQADASDIIKVAQNLIEKDEELKEYGYEQLFNVYDEIVGFAYEDVAGKALERKLFLMKEPGIRFKLPFPLQVEGKVADNWLAAK